MQIRIITQSGYVNHIGSCYDPATGDVYFAITKDTAAGPCNCEIVRRSPNGARTIVAVFAEALGAPYPAGVPVYVVGKAGYCTLEMTTYGLIIGLSARVTDANGTRQAWIEACI